MSNPFLEPGGPVFTVPFSASALTTNPQDLFCVTASSLSRVAIREIRFGQYSDFGDAQAEILSILLMTGSTAPSSGTAITPRNVRGHSGAPSAQSSVLGPSTTLASTASAVLRLADIANVAAGWWYRPDNPERIILEPSQRLVARLSAPNDALTVNGTLVLQEIGKNAV